MLKQKAIAWSLLFSLLVCGAYGCVKKPVVVEEEPLNESQFTELIQLRRKTKRLSEKVEQLTSDNKRLQLLAKEKRDRSALLNESLRKAKDEIAYLTQMIDALKDAPKQRDKFEKDAKKFEDEADEYRRKCVQLEMKLLLLTNKIPAESQPK